MQSVGSLLKNTSQLRLVASRQMSVLSGPPRVKISFAEKVAHGVVMTAGMLFVPVWVLVNIKNYRNRQ